MFNVGVHFHFNIVILSVKFIVFTNLCYSEVFVCHLT